MTPISKKAALNEKASVSGEKSEKDNPEASVLAEEASAAAVSQAVEKAAQPEKAPAAPTKTVSEPVPEKAKADREAAEKEQAERLQNAQYRFISPFPRLVLYVYMGLTEMVDGRERPAPTKIQFKNGGFFTSNAQLGEALRAHPKCGSQLFRFVSGADAAARMTVASQEEERMRTPSFQGPTGSSDGNEQEFIAQQAAIQRMKHQAFHG